MNAVSEAQKIHAENQKAKLQAKLNEALAALETERADAAAIVESPTIKTQRGPKITERPTTDQDRATWSTVRDEAASKHAAVAYVATALDRCNEARAVLDLNWLGVLDNPTAPRAVRENKLAWFISKTYGIA